MNPIFLVVGPPAVGKSTTSRMLAEQFAKSLYIPVDDIRHMVVSGLVLPSEVWSNDLVEQVRLARQSVTQTTLAYSRAGFAVVIDDFWSLDYAGDYSTLFAQSYTHKIVLYPEQREAHRRNAVRCNGVPSDYIDQGIKAVYQ